MSFEINQVVEVVDIPAVENDVLLEESALDILEKSMFQGTVTKIENGINFVGFKNELGWVTQGYKDNEIKAVK